MDGESHDFLTKQILTSWPDHQNIPLLNPDLILSVDGSCLQDATGKLVSSCAVYTVHGTLEVFALPSVSSAQAAELVDLIRACVLDQSQSATIYPDSCYVFGVVRDFGQLWNHWFFYLYRLSY